MRNADAQAVQSKSAWCAAARTLSHMQVRVPLSRCWHVPRPEQFSGQLYLVMLSVRLQLCASSPLTPTK